MAKAKMTRKALIRDHERRAETLTREAIDALPEEDSQLDPLRSSRGDNVYTLRGCHIYPVRHYAACVSIVNRHEKKRPCFMNTECNAALDRGVCLAKRLRDKEEEAGRALFFKRRADTPPGHVKKDHDVLSPSYQRGWNQVGVKLHDEPSIVGRPKRTKTSVAPKPAVEKSRSDDISIAAAVEKMVKEEKGE